MKARTARSGYDRIGIAIKPWLGKEVRRSLVYPNECVLVAGDAAELVGTELLVTLYNGLAIYIGGYDSSMGTSLHILFVALIRAYHPVPLLFLAAKTMSFTLCEINLSSRSPPSPHTQPFRNCVTCSTNSSGYWYCAP